MSDFYSAVEHSLLLPTDNSIPTRFRSVHRRLLSQAPIILASYVLIELFDFLLYHSTLLRGNSIVVHRLSICS